MFTLHKSTVLIAIFGLGLVGCWKKSNDEITAVELTEPEPVEEELIETEPVEEELIEDIDPDELSAEDDVLEDTDVRVE